MRRLRRTVVSYGERQGCEFLSVLLRNLDAVVAQDQEARCLTHFKR